MPGHCPQSDENEFLECGLFTCSMISKISKSCFYSSISLTGSTTDLFRHRGTTFMVEERRTREGREVMAGPLLAEDTKQDTGREGEGVF